MRILLSRPFRARPVTGTAAKRLRLYPAWLAAALCLLVRIAEGATLLVPNSFPTITSALGAASPGDTVRITDSSTYQEDLVFHKPVFLEALPGETPTILASGSASSVLWTTNASIGTRIGSLDGGRIIIDGGSLSAISVIVGQDHEGPGTVVYENLVVRNPTASNSMIYPSKAGNSVFRDVEFDAGGVCQFPIRLDFLGGATLTFEGVTLHNAPDIGLFCGNSTGFGRVEIRSSRIETSMRPFLIQPGSGAFVFDIENSWIRNLEDTQSWIVFSVRSAGSEIHLEASVVEARGVGYAFYFFAGFDDMVLTLDHCDVLSESIALGFQPAENRHFTITDSNIVAESSSFTGMLGATDQFTADYNNLSAGYNGFEIGLHDYPGAVPGYYDTTAGDFRYDTPVQLLTADSNGGPIGSQRGFTPMVGPTAVPTLTPTVDPNVTPTPTPQYTSDELAYIQAFNQVFVPLQPPFTYEEYIVAAPYDVFLGSVLDDSIAQMQNGQRIPSAGFGYWMESFNEMYLFTKDIRYARAMLKLVRAILDYRDDVRGVPLFDGTVQPVWGLDIYSTLGREAFVIDDGMVTYPILWFLEIARDHPEVAAELEIGEYEEMLAMIDENLEYYLGRQYRQGPGPDEAHLYFDRYDDARFLDDPQPVNWMSSFGRSLWLSWELTANTNHRNVALELARYAKNRISLATDGAYYWAYWLPYQPVTTDPVPRETIRGIPGFAWIEDIPHAALTISFWILMAEKNQIFNQEDLTRFGKTVTLGFARIENGVLLPDLVGNPIISLISRVPSISPFFRLTPYDPEVYRRLTDFYFSRYPSPNALQRALILRYHSLAEPTGPVSSYWRVR